MIYNQSTFNCSKSVVDVYYADFDIFGSNQWCISDITVDGDVWCGISSCISNHAGGINIYIYPCTQLSLHSIYLYIDVKNYH